MIDSAPIDCAKCGTPHTRCTAHARNNEGKPCRNPRMKGQTVCRMHGGASKAAREKGLRKYELDKAIADSEALIAHLPGEAVTDPMAVLAQLAAEAIAMKDALARRVNALERLRFTDDKSSEQLRSEVVLYERALDRAAKFVEIMAKSGFEGARIRLQQEQGMLVYGVLRRVIEQLQLNEQQQAIAVQVVPLELRKIGAAQGESS